MLWGVGPKAKIRLAELGVRTIGVLTLMPEDRLIQLFGEHGLDLATRARGDDKRPVVEEREPRSMSAELTFERDLSDHDLLSRTLLQLSERVGSRLRKAMVVGRTVRIKLRWPDFTTLTRQTRLVQPTDQDGEIYRAALGLFYRVWSEGRLVRLLGVGVSDLSPPVRQLTLFNHTWEKDGRLLKAIDDIRTRYGSDAVRRAGNLKLNGLNDHGVEDDSSS